MYGIENLKKVLALAIEIGNVADAIQFKEGVAAKLQELVALTDELVGLASVDFKMIPHEISDLDDSEKAQLNQFIKDKFNIADDKLEFAIEGGIGILLKLEGLVKEASELVRNLKSA